MKKLALFAALLVAFSSFADRGTRDNEPGDLFAVKLSTQGDGTGTTTNNVAGKSVGGSTNADPIVITATSHGFSDGDLVFITGITGNTNANGLRIVANKDTNTFELTDLTGTDVAGNGTHGGSGLVYPALWYQVPTGKHLYIVDFTLHASDTASSGDGYMAESRLTNGLKLVIYQGTTALKTLDPGGIKDFADWSFVPGVNVVNTGIAGSSDAISYIRGPLGDKPLMINGNANDALILYQQDDLSGLLNQEAGLWGYLEDVP